MAVVRTLIDHFFGASGWGIPLTLFLLGLIVWFIGVLITNSPVGGLSGLIGGAIGVFALFLMFARGYSSLAIIALSLLGIILILSFGFDFRWGKKERAEGPYSHLLGQQGTCVTDLHPKGKANFNGEEVEVVSEGLFISEGTPIRSIRVKDKTIVVEKIG